MNDKRKAWLAAGLITLSAGIWTPQLVGEEEGELARYELAAEIPAETEVPGAGVIPSPATPADAPLPEPPGDAVAEGMDIAAAPEAEPLAASAQRSSAAGPLADLGELETALRAIDSLLPRRREDALDLLVGGVASVREESAVEAAPASEALSHEEQRERLAAFAAENPFTGLVRGPDGALALLGHRVVRAGQLLDGGALAVEEIGAGWLRLAATGSGGEVGLVVELPPFVAGGAESPDGLENEGAVEAQAEETPEEEAPAGAGA